MTNWHFAQNILGSEVLIVNVSSPKAVLLIFHGCSHSATDWWFTSPACPQCLGAASVTLKAECTACMKLMFNFVFSNRFLFCGTLAGMRHDR